MVRSPETSLAGDPGPPPGFFLSSGGKGEVVMIATRIFDVWFKEIK